MSDDRPPVTAEQHDLPFHQLLPQRFEQLCYWLLEAEGYRDVRHYGAAGADGGRDLVALDPDGRRTVVQCKRYLPSSDFGPKQVRREVEKVLEPKLEDGEAPPPRPEHYVLAITRSFSVDARKALDEALSGIPSTVWDLTTLDHRVRGHRQTVERFFGLPGEPVPVWTVPPRNPFFTGRESHLETLAKRLREHGSAALTQAITGLGGVGKTQTAIALCYRIGGDYRDVLWCDASSAETLQRDYAEVARGLGLFTGELPDEEAAKVLRAWLAGRSGWLVVLDNADEPEAITAWLPRGRQGHLLITSRVSDLGELDVAEPCDVDVLSLEEAAEFLAARTGRETCPESLELAEELGRLPLALEQAAAYLVANRSVDYPRYLKVFRQRRLELLERSPPKAGRYHSDVASTWSLTVEKIGASFPAAVEVLQGLAYVAPDRIPVVLIEEGLAHFGPESSGIAAELEQDSLLVDEKVIAPLARYSLVRYEVETDGSQLSMHRLLQEVVRCQLMPTASEARWLGISRAMEAVSPPGSGEHPSTWGRWRLLLHHVLAHADPQRPASSAVEPATLWARAGIYARAAGTYATARSLFEEVLELRRPVLGEDHPETLRSMGNLASTLRNQGEYQAARSLDEQVLELRRRVLGEDHPETLMSMGSLASTLRNQGEYQAARSLEQQVLELSRRVLGEDHPETLTSMGNLASTLWNQGEYQAARSLDEQVLELSRRVLGEDHPETLMSMGNLASTLRNQGEYQAARSLEEQVLELRRRVLGEDHPETLMSMGNLALTLRNQGEYQAARSLDEQVLELRRRVLGEDHPETLMSMGNLASTLSHQGEYQAARSLEEQVLELSRRVLGEDHPETLRSMGNLASTLWNQGEYQAARSLEEQVLELSRRVLGEDHPQTLWSTFNLAVTLRDVGEETQAAELEARLIEGAKKLPPKSALREAMRRHGLDPES